MKAVPSQKTSENVSEVTARKVRDPLLGRGFNV